MNGREQIFRFGREWIPPSHHGPHPVDCVRLLMGERGTEVRWVVDVPNIASLFAAALRLPDCQPPFVLRIYAGGWFEEKYVSNAEAQGRIHDLTLRGDRFLPSRVFVEESIPNALRTPAVLWRALQNEDISGDLTIECVCEPDTGNFIVQKVGDRSAIGRVWGTNPSTWPCQTSGVYGACANAAYEKVITEGRSRYEQVVAALRFPDDVLRWIPYHRLIRPLRHSRRPAVQVISDFAEVDFRVL